LVIAGWREASVKRALVVVALVAVPLRADDVYLRGGGQITGEIVEQSADSVTVDIGGGTFSVRMSSVVRIEEGTSPLQEYRARAGRIAAGDAEAWRELARWATGRALGTMASEAWSKVVAVLPDDPEANGALGRVQLNGRWVTEEESYRAQGYVEFEGEWMTPGERQSILEDRKAREEADRRALEAQIQADEKARKEREARETEEREEFLRGGLPQYGDPVSWGWGYGPVYWPSTPVQRPQPGRPGQGPVGGPR
jgi:hypothetical protein